MDPARAREQLVQLRRQLLNVDLDAPGAQFPTLRSVDAKVREAKLLLGAVGLTQILDELARDEDFAANSRRVRLEALANYCTTAITFLDAGEAGSKKRVVKGPSLVKLTGIMPGLEEVIQARWIDAQRCQHAGAYLAAVILMGSILEGLLLARAQLDSPSAHRANRAPRRKDGSSVALQDWKLSALIDVAVEVGWLKNDRGQFSHAPASVQERRAPLGTRQHWCRLR